ncbi:DHBP synthase RibB-like alpha/beta domain-containing protein [Arabidopsis thaliana]|jgi:tRNA threonylcarbamoyl adenosine modification protein (Sua5/YciO/YrdC/YwlC family)|uniref:Threonylcarbamoyl-AMP synthase n=1 Tax=Arabidopsis thaliana TaxID=3702 RepID=A0A1I9LM38_ARATH|nr:DHBP synthase RibB-like alpha/beta domain-containing protein [Arabidopsis thaliana]ANM63646.1 DHBP synthase RibB-like alpha/beta domain-containing protein [Arabidopsis thaliana]|eukprot:NP_001325721.1 DHBP synthase RibB-like alpha/beta domain-containing protein [Arabidopsis thaliana]
MAVAKLHGGGMAAMRLLLLPSPMTHRRPSTLPSTASLSPRRYIVALAAKRSPKRLKYSTPRFTKEGELVYIEVDPCGVDSWKLQPVIDLLKQGAVGVIPTDTVYAIACDCKNHSAVERLRRIKKIESSKPLSILCRSLRDIDTFTMGFPRGDGHGHANVFRAVKQCLPGPYTFILTASKELPKQCVGYGTTSVKYASRKNVGVRISDDALCQAILQQMDAPLICTSVKGPKENEWMIDPTAIGDIYGPEVFIALTLSQRLKNIFGCSILCFGFLLQGLDFVVDGGIRVAEPSTIVDMTGPYPKVIREGKGPILPWMVVEDDESSLRQDLMASGT